MRRLARILALCLCGLLVFSGCQQPGPEPTPSGTAEPAPTPTPSPTAAPEPVRFSLGYDPAASLHPITGDSQVNQELTGLVYQGLYELDNTFTPQPVLASGAYVMDEGLTWVFSLKSGAVFSDGSPVTAQAAAASLELARTSPLYAARLADVTAVEAGEDGRVRVTLSAPNGNLPALLDIPIVLEQTDLPVPEAPPEPDESMEPEPAGPVVPLGTGYYQYEWAAGNLYLKANPRRAAARALPYATIPLSPASETAERIAAFDSGAVTAVTTDFSSPYALGYSSSYETTDFPTTSLLYVGFKANGGVCASLQVRQAFSKAFDRDELVRVQLSTHGDAAALPISPLSGEYSETAAARLSYDPDGAARLLEEAGYVLSQEDRLRHKDEGGEPLAVTLAVNSDNDVRQAAAARLARSLEELGVTVTVEHLPWSDFVAALTAGRFDLYIGEVRLTGDFDPSALLAGALNYGGFYSEGLTGALTQWRAARGTARTQAANALWDQFAQTVPIAPLCFKRGSLLMRWGMATNLQPTRANPYAQIEHWTTAD